MRKKIGAATSSEEGWLALETIASVEVTSEDSAHPIESAFGSEGTGWRAASPGAQTVRLVFDHPQRITRIHLEIEERAVARTQELAIAWSASTDNLREILRQRWNFSPDGATHESEDYQVSLEDVHILELRLVPDVGGGTAIASLRRFRVR